MMSWAFSLSAMENSERKNRCFSQANRFLDVFWFSLPAPDAWTPFIDQSALE
uniref:Eukaryotic translation initiation factor 4B n=1 Tax=Pan troglodytes TaxID=9598 RepID=G2HIK8_PANTR|nr:hypothetical protein [Pan troglodytes]